MLDLVMTTLSNFETWPHLLVRQGAKDIRLPQGGLTAELVRTSAETFKRHGLWPPYGADAEGGISPQPLKH